MNDIPTIDLARVLRSKLGDRSRFVPKWLVRRLERLVHQDWINAFILAEGDRQGVEWLEDCVRYTDIHLKVLGLENLPPDDGKTRFTFVSNHPLGGADGVLLGAILGRYYKGRIRYLANDLLMNLKGLAPLIVPINKTGGQSRETSRLVNEAYASDQHLIVFPAGLCSRKIGGRIQDVPWNKSFITKSQAAGRDIVPIYFEGRNSDRFYGLARLQQWLGLKFNLAMILLPDELYRHRGSTFVIRIGKKIDHTTLTADKSSTQWAQQIRNLVYHMGEGKAE